MRVDDRAVANEDAEESERNIMAAIKSLSEQYPERDNDFDLWNEVLPEVDRMEAERINDGG